MKKDEDAKASFWSLLWVNLLAGDFTFTQAFSIEKFYRYILTLQVGAVQN